MRARIVLFALAAPLLGAAAAWTAGNDNAGARPPGAFASRSPAADLYALADSVARRAKELDLADLRIQEERRLLEKVKEEVRRDVAALDRKLAELERRNVELGAERKAARQYVARVFRSMEAPEAARRLQLMSDREAASLLREMKEKDAAKIMAQMEPEFSVSVAKRMEGM